MRKVLIVLALFVGIGPVACTDRSAETPNAKKDAAPPKKDHGQWWCDEHGLPEEVCWACNDKYCQQCKKEGDWCEKHERPKSQCFKCDPKLKDEWAKKYVAKYGKKPPEPDDY